MRNSGSRETSPKAMMVIQCAKDCGLDNKESFTPKFNLLQETVLKLHHLALQSHKYQMILEIVLGPNGKKKQFEGSICLQSSGPKEDIPLGR